MTMEHGTAKPTQFNPYGIEAYTIAHLRYKVVRVTVAVIVEPGVSWTAYATDYRGGHYVREQIGETDIEFVPRFGKVISAADAQRAFSSVEGLWAQLNDFLGTYAENPHQ